MSYRPPDEDPEISLENILKGLSKDNVQDLQKVISNCEESRRYKDKYIDDLNELYSTLKSARRQIQDILN